ncbi:MAG: hypothetical protein M1816_007083 [Peltula sp. TS41687]|nr:MAG: hypothetical protein M1816_007083 [Peltula sp. TS41687]
MDGPSGLQGSSKIVLCEEGELEGKLHVEGMNHNERRVLQDPDVVKYFLGQDRHTAYDAWPKCFIREVHGTRNNEDMEGIIASTWKALIDASQVVDLGLDQPPRLRSPGVLVTMDAPTV